MSFNRKRYDEQETNLHIESNNEFGDYTVSNNNCNSCYQQNPSVRLQKSGNILSVNVENDLMNINRKNEMFVPDCSNNNNCQTQELSKKKVNELNECNLDTYDSRLSDPSPHLSEIGNNRWEWLKHGNPQNNAIQPSELLGNSTRITFKDSFVPCFDVPMEQTNELN